MHWLCGWILCSLWGHLMLRLCRQLVFRVCGRLVHCLSLWKYIYCRVFDLRVFRGILSVRLWIDPHLLGVSRWLLVCFRWLLFMLKLRCGDLFSLWLHGLLLVSFE